MIIQLINATSIVLSQFTSDALDIRCDDPDLHFGAVPMFVVSLATCTYSILASYGQRIDADTEDLVVNLQWRYKEKPHRIGDIKMGIKWPQVPESRLDAAMRAAAQCTIHKTLDHGVEVETDISN